MGFQTQLISQETERQSANTGHVHSNLYLILGFTVRPKTTKIIFKNMVYTKIDQPLRDYTHDILDKTELNIIQTRTKWKWK